MIVRKLIGARYFERGFAEVLVQNNLTFSGEVSARDMDGHGTHTLSIAGGNVVPEVDAPSVRTLEMKNATVRGGSPRARVVAYKVLWPEASTEIEKTGDGNFMDALAGLEAAISDGVDVINLSMGMLYQPEDIKQGGDMYFKDSLAIGSFHAMANGILVVAGAGNNGPIPSSTVNVAPWILTVGAGTMDREFTCYVFLGNKQKIRVCVSLTFVL